MLRYFFTIIILLSRMTKLTLMAYTVLKATPSNKTQGLSLAEMAEEILNDRYRADLRFKLINDSLSDAGLQSESRLLSTLWSSYKSALERGNRTMFTEIQRTELYSFHKSSPYSASPDLMVGCTFLIQPFLKLRQIILTNFLDANAVKDIRRCI